MTFSLSLPKRLHIPPVSYLSSRADLSRIHFSFLLFNSLLSWFVPSSSLCELISFLALSQVMSCCQSCSRGGLMAQREEAAAVEEERPGLLWMMSSWLSHRSWSYSILCVNSTPSTRKSVASAAAARSWTRSTPRSCRYRSLLQCFIVLLYREELGRYFLFRLVVSLIFTLYLSIVS